MHFELRQSLQRMTTTAVKEGSAEENRGKMTELPAFSPDKIFWVLWPGKGGSLLFILSLLGINCFLLSVVTMK